MPTPAAAAEPFQEFRAAIRKRVSFFHTAAGVRVRITGVLEAVNIDGYGQLRVTVENEPKPSEFDIQRVSQFRVIEQIKESTGLVTREEILAKHGVTDVDVVNHPPHYTSHPSGVECIQITRHMSFNIGNAVKYLWRADLKNAAIEDLKKAVWYINDEIARREAAS